MKWRTALGTALLMAALAAWPAPAAAQETEPAPAAAPADTSPGPFDVRDLSFDVCELSCIDAASCIQILGMLGYKTQAPSGQVELSQLPAVFSLPFKDSVPVVGRSELKAADVALREDTLSAPQNRLMIAYHPSQSEQVAKLKELLATTVDVPDRQVLIEGMVIELTETDLKELGVQWQYYAKDMLQVTFLSETDKEPFTLTFNPGAPATSDLADRLRTTIRAVIQEGKGEVLSSPSVLVLNNRNARIKVVRDTPIISTKITQDVQNVDVRFEPVGIVLNIKPRISQDDSTVTMQIIAEVSEVPEGKAIVVTGTEVAPYIDRRVVETVARVYNNTPFIIGGLIRNQNSQAVDRIPILSRIPILGVLFRRTVTRREKREVIIVLTPRVISTAGTHRPLMPKDAARFDFLDNRLFRNSYRIKAEDVFDLGFLESNETILAAFDRAGALVRRHPEYAGRLPFKEFAARVIPGEDAVVIRMLYEIAKDKLRLEEQIPTENLIYFESDPQKPAGFSVKFLQDKIKEVSPDGTVDSFLAQTYPKKVLLFRYSASAEAGLQAALSSPVARVERREAAGRDEVEDILLGINRLGEDYRYHEFAFVVDTAKDLVRLKTAVSVRETADVNNFEELLTLRNFRVGRRFVIPEFDRSLERMFLVDQTVAEVFFKSDYYYPALKARLEGGYKVLDEALRKEGME
jgi:Flp pilus assembly secretin CpaC